MSTPNTKNSKLPKWDQADFMARNDQLIAEMDRFTAAIKASGRAFPAPPAAVNSTDLIEQNEALEAYVPVLSVIARFGPVAKPAQGDKLSLTDRAIAVKEKPVSPVSSAARIAEPTLTQRALAAKPKA
jgi:hypothetical protein